MKEFLSSSLLPSVRRFIQIALVLSLCCAVLGVMPSVGECAWDASSSVNRIDTASPSADSPSATSPAAPAFDVVILESRIARVSTHADPSPQAQQVPAKIKLYLASAPVSSTQKCNCSTCDCLACSCSAPAHRAQLASSSRSPSHPFAAVCTDACGNKTISYSDDPAGRKLKRYLKQGVRLGIE